jgi:hypothetical protein
MTIIDGTDYARGLQLFDLPGGLVVDDHGRAAADRLVKFHHSVGNRSRDAFIFPRATQPQQREMARR